MTTHPLPAWPPTIRIGVFHARIPAVVTMESRDTMLRRQMIALTCACAARMAAQAHQAGSLAADFPVTHAVNGKKGVPGRLCKGLLF